MCLSVCLSVCLEGECVYECVCPCGWLGVTLGSSRGLGGGAALVELCETVTDSVSVDSCIVKRVVGVLCRGTFL